jgi:archaellum component FlaC
MVPAVQTPPAPAPAPAVELPEPPKGTPKLSVTPDRVEKLLEQAYARLETLGNQLRAAASELEEIRAEILTANNLCDSELRSQLQQANDEIYKLRNSLAECAERKVNKMDKKELMDI